MFCINLFFLFNFYIIYLFIKNIERRKVDYTLFASRKEQTNYDGVYIFKKNLTDISYYYNNISNFSLYLFIFIYYSLILFIYMK